MIVKTLTSLLVVLLVAIQFAGGDDAKDKPTLDFRLYRRNEAMGRIVCLWWRHGFRALQAG